MTQEPQALWRRRTLMTAAIGGLAASLTGPATSAAASSRWRNALIINALGGLGDPNDRGGPSGQFDDTPSDRVLRDARASGLNAVNITLGYVSGPDDPFESSVRDVAEWDRIVRARPDVLSRVLTADDILRAKTENRIGLIFGFQNAAMMGDRADRVDIFANLGVRVIQLTYNPANRLGHGSMSPANGGLTPFGREVVARLNARRVIVDLSHSGERTCLDAIAASPRPISINHTGCRALTDLPRNKTDAELRGVAEKGGFVGIYFMPFLSPTGHATPEDVVAHIEHALQVCGEDHVGIGTDGVTTPVDDMTAYRASLAKEVAARKAAGIGASGERADTLPFVEGLNGVDQFRDLADRLARRGHRRSRIEKILGGNFLRFAREIWG
jgi:membrane dipeptidase